MSIVDWFGIALSFAIGIYLLVALLRPDKFE